MIVETLNYGVGIAGGCKFMDAQGPLRFASSCLVGRIGEFGVIECRQKLLAINAIPANTRDLLFEETPAQRWMIVGTLNYGVGIAGGRKFMDAQGPLGFASVCLCWTDRTIWHTECCQELLEVRSLNNK
ncbi:hypothetical protein CEXT_264221 [Caerostris extrusa]|uniref:Uncharacterized protein n=1 Tax=Caerostris extrusa TaxID=172846 RepID=A0AAV4TKX0_CAEEX|nr:hypothetical protein CEXT_264221 [Caerostris extrusa]